MQSKLDYKTTKSVDIEPFKNTQHSQQKHISQKDYLKLFTSYNNIKE